MIYDIFIDKVYFNGVWHNAPIELIDFFKEQHELAIRKGVLQGFIEYLKDNT